MDPMEMEMDAACIRRLEPSRDQSTGTAIPADGPYAALNPGYDSNLQIGFDILIAKLAESTRASNTVTFAANSAKNGLWEGGLHAVEVRGNDVSTRLRQKATKHRSREQGIRLTRSRVGVAMAASCGPTGSYRRAVVVVGKGLCDSLYIAIFVSFVIYLYREQPASV
ncbi:hypothetical protein BC830DRAFT_1168584 [Chytriomyces sp. MP71]|nr:hypothetical protein BC830DRAFT_1168584 [Chytriomyces sp. MP71]